MKALKFATVAMLLVVGNAFGQPSGADADQKVAVKELLEAMNFKQVLSQMSGAMMQQMPQMMDQMIEGFAGKGKLTPEQKAEAKRYALEGQTSMSKQMVEMYNDPEFVQGFEDIMARSYARHFTTDEIRATTAFYVSSAGKKTLTTMPRMMQETMPEILAMISPRMNAMIEKTAKAMVAKVEKDSKASSTSK